MDSVEEVLERCTPLALEKQTLLHSNHRRREFEDQRTSVRKQSVSASLSVHICVSLLYWTFLLNRGDEHDVYYAQPSIVVTPLP